MIIPCILALLLGLVNKYIAEMIPIIIPKSGINNEPKIVPI